MSSLWLLLFSAFFQTQTVDLNKITGWNKESYFKDSVYAEHTWESFYQLKEIRKPLDYTHPDIHLVNACVFYCINKLRVSHGQEAFMLSDELRQAAAWHSYQMLERNFFGFTNEKDTAIGTIQKRAQFFSYDYRKTSSALKKDYLYATQEMSYIVFAEDVVSELMQSGNSKLFYDKDFKDLAVGIVFEKQNYRDKSRMYLLTVNFGVRKE
jgi:hypothetical protein